MPTNSSAPPQTHRASGRGRNVSGEGVKWAVSRRVWPPRRRGDSGTANIAAPKDSTTRAAKDGPVWFHCSAPAVRYEGKCGADSAHANHSENEPSMKGLIGPIIEFNVTQHFCYGMRIHRAFRPTDEYAEPLKYICLPIKWA